MLEQILVEVKKIPKGDLKEDSLMTAEDVCKYLQISTRTCQNMRNSRMVPYVKVGKKILFRRSDINEFVNKHLTPKKDHSNILIVKRPINYD